MSINSSSTFEQVQASYDDNASYEETNDVTKCRAFITAARILLRRTPAQSRSSQGEVRMQMELIQKEIDAATSWLQSQSSGSGNASESATGGPRAIYIGLRNSRG